MGSKSGSGGPKFYSWALIKKYLTAYKVYVTNSSYLAVREDMCRKEYHVVYRTEQCRGLWYRFRVFSLFYRNSTAEHLYQEMQVCRHVTSFTSCQNKSDICERENNQRAAEQNY